MLFAFLVLGTPWFWLFLIAPALLLIWLVEDERAGFALATVVLFAAIWAMFGDPKIVPWIIANPFKVAEYIGIYIVAGIGWGFVKWFFQVLRAKDKYEKMRAAFVKDQDGYSKRSQLRKLGDNHQRRDTEAYKAAEAAIKAQPKKTGFDKVLFKDYAANEARIDITSFPPKAYDNKGKIVFWMSYWPFSATWTLINDPVTRFYNFLYRRLGAAFDHISHSMFGKYKDDLTEDEDKDAKTAA